MIIKNFIKSSVFVEEIERVVFRVSIVFGGCRKFFEEVGRKLIVNCVGLCDDYKIGVNVLLIIFLVVF